MMGALYFVQSAAAVLLIFSLFKFLFGFEKRKIKALFAVFAVLCAVLSASIPFLEKDSLNADEYNEYVLIFIFAVLPSFMFRHRKRMLVPILGLLIVFTLDYIIYMIKSSFEITSFAVISIMYSLLYLIISAVLIVFRKRVNTESVQALLDSISPAFYVIILIADFSAFYDADFSADPSSYIGVSRAIRLISTVLIVAGMVYIIVKYTGSLYQQKETEMQIDMQVKLYSEMMNNNREVRKFRHDYKNNLFSLETFIENEKYEAAKEYIRELNGTLESTKSRFATGNYLADAILTDKADKVVASEIEIVFSGSIPENGISNNDICTVLANSLDNAIRACQPVAPCRIMIDSTESSKGVIIKIKNPVDKKVEIKNNKIKTTKSDKVNHGFGVGNIIKAAKKNGGYAELSCDDEFFEIEIGMYYKKTEG